MRIIVALVLFIVIASIDSKAAYSNRITEFQLQRRLKQLSSDETNEQKVLWKEFVQLVCLTFN